MHTVSSLCGNCRVKAQDCWRRCGKSVMRHPVQWPLVFLALAQIKIRSMFNDLVKKRHMMTL